MRNGVSGVKAGLSDFRLFAWVVNDLTSRWLFSQFCWTLQCSMFGVLTLTGVWKFQVLRLKIATEERHWPTVVNALVSSRIVDLLGMSSLK